MRIASPPTRSTSSRSSAAARRMRPSARPGPRFATFDVGGHQPAGAGQGIVVGQDRATAVAQAVAAGAASLGDAVRVGGGEEGSGVDVLLGIRGAAGSPYQLLRPAAHGRQGGPVHVGRRRTISAQNGQAGGHVGGGARAVAAEDVPFGEQGGKKTGGAPSGRRRGEQHGPQPGMEG